MKLHLKEERKLEMNIQNSHSNVEQYLIDFLDPHPIQFDSDVEIEDQFDFLAYLDYLRDSADFEDDDLDMRPPNH